MPQPSIFSKIIAKELPATIRYEDELFLAFDDISPKAPIHVVLITKQAFATLEEIPLEDLELQGKLLQTARKIAQKLGISKNYKLHMNVGLDVQAVHHLHLHILGGWANTNPSETVPL